MARVENGRKSMGPVVVKPAGPDCTLDCAYCFYLDRREWWPEQSRHRMSLETLETLIETLFQEGGSSVSVAWQGGEPALMGLDFYRRAIASQIRHGRGKSVSNSFQTGGHQMDPQWARFFRQHAFLVGLSLDGPEHVHDRYRRGKAGQGTWRRVDAAARMLLGEGVAVNALSTVTDHSARHLEETYAYLKGLGFTHLQFIPILESDRNRPGELAPYSVDPDAYGDILCRLFDLWMDDLRQGRPTISVRFFESLFYTYVGQEPPDCTFQETCGPYLVVEHDGSVYSCDFFVEGPRRLGFIQTGGLRALFEDPRHLAFGREKARLDAECGACPWLQQCRGGCPKDRLRDPRDAGHFHFCRSHLALFRHADVRMKTLAAAYRALA